MKNFSSLCSPDLDQDTWVGITNDRFVNCSDSQACHSQLQWIDGSPLSSTDSSSLPSITIQQGHMCVKMKRNSASLTDENCIRSLHYLCHLDCNNKFIGLRLLKLRSLLISNYLSVIIQVLYLPEKHESLRAIQKPCLCLYAIVP